MREYKVRLKNAQGKPTSKWHSVYANSEKEAVLAHQMQVDMGMYAPQPRARKPKW
jgi:hypothetical protein